MKQIIIVKSKTTTIKFFKTYIELITDYENRIIGLQHIQTLYINHNIKIPNLVKIAKAVDIFVIHDDGTILKKIDAKI